MSRYGEIVPICSKIQYIPGEYRDPHYTDERFTRAMGGKTIFLAEGLVAVRSNFGGEHVEGAHYNYSDRISQGFGYKKVRAAHEEAREAVGNNDTAAYYEAMLQRVYEDPATELQHLIAGVNNATGYSYHIYGTVSGSSTER
ncbi:MAG TPA: hypothetical protein VMR95_01350 [Candidatus Binatia bacterium]|nr:hypothetical protein [Candidatus Binatia bacterium]